MIDFVNLEGKTQIAFFRLGNGRRVLSKIHVNRAVMSIDALVDVDNYGMNLIRLGGTIYLTSKNV